METFWNSLIYVATVLFFSAVIIVREWLSARLQKNVQIEFDAKLESVKAEFQKQLDEHRTQFNYWHMEQSSAMKKSFEDICDLYSNQKYLQMVETAPTWKENKNQETARSILKEKIILSLDEAAQGWLKARLFLEDKDDVKVGAFHLKTGNLFYYLFNPENPKSIEIIEIFLVLEGRSCHTGENVWHIHLAGTIENTIVAEEDMVVLRRRCRNLRTEKRLRSPRSNVLWETQIRRGSRILVTQLDITQTLQQQDALNQFIQFRHVLVTAIGIPEVLEHTVQCLVSRKENVIGIEGIVGKIQIGSTMPLRCNVWQAIEIAVIDRVTSIFGFRQILRHILIGVEQLLDQLIFTTIRNLLIDSAGRFNDVVHMIEITVVGHHRLGIQHCGIHHIESIGQVLGIPLGIGEEIVVILLCINT